MAEVHFLEELLIVLATTIAIVFLFQKVRLPAIVGFLLAGVLIGPGGLGVIPSVNQVEVLAEIGVALLLFTIGVEFSLESVLSMQRRILWAGFLQVSLTILTVMLIAVAFGITPKAAVFYGFLVALSSTAIVLRIYNDRGETNAIQGRLASGILLFQDLCIVPLMLMVPVLGGAEGSYLEIALAVGKSIVALFLIVWTARKLFPWLLHQVALVRNREVFILFVVLVCLGTAWLASAAGLSLALGALIAGLVISESELSHQVVADALPLRDCFSGIFFISIGMLLNPQIFAHDFVTPVLELLILVATKTVVLLVIFWRLYGSLRLGIILGLSLAQIGEFSFILAKAGIGFDLLSPSEEQTFLAASILSMIATPFLISSAHHIANRWSVRTGERRSTELPAEDGAARLEGHVLIVGYGLNGQNLARVLREAAISHRILELDPELVQSGKAAGAPIDFGDGTRPDILRQAGIARARILVVAISDPNATAHIVSQARRLRKDLKIIVRTRYVSEIERLYGLGADEVIPEEFETSVEIFARVLQEYHVPRNVIALQIELIRKEHYGALRGMRLEGKRLDELNRFLIGATTDIVSVLDTSPSIGQSLRQLALRERTGATVIAAVRDGKPAPEVGPDFALQAGDLLVVLGDHKALDEATRLINPRADSATE